MALISLLTGIRQTVTTVNRIVPVKQPDGTTENKKFTAFTLDALLSENYQGDAEPTQNPVEQGVDVTDHIIIKPRKLTIQGVITSSPITTGTQIQGLVTGVAAAAGTALAGPLGSVVGGLGGAFAGKSLAGLLGQSTGRTLQDVIDEFEHIRTTRLPIEIVTGLKVYQDMVLISYSVTRDVKMGQSFSASLSFQEIRFANSRLVRVRLPKKDLTGANDKKDNGRQATTDPTPEQGKRTSLALQGFKKLGLAN